MKLIAIFFTAVTVLVTLTKAKAATYSLEPVAVQKLERRESGMIAIKFVATLDLISLLHPLRVRDQLSAEGKNWRGGFKKGAIQ
jgi:hypothetical protein